METDLDAADELEELRLLIERSRGVMIEVAREFATLRPTKARPFTEAKPEEFIATIKAREAEEPACSAVDALAFVEGAIALSPNQLFTDEDIRRAETRISCVVDRPQATGAPPHELRLRLPYLLVEHQKQGQSEREVLNRIRLHCASAVAFLQELGIVGFPVFALTACGYHGALMMGWENCTKEQSRSMASNDSQDSAESTQRFDDVSQDGDP